MSTRRLSREAAQDRPLRRRTTRNHSFRFSRGISEILRACDWRDRCIAPRMHGIEKRIVYVLRSDTDPSKQYVGITNDVESRLEWHNHGPYGHTLSNRPWSLIVAMEFSSERDAVSFEHYLKSGSGRAFAKRH